MLNIPGLPAFYRINEISIMKLLSWALKDLKSNILKTLNYENEFFSFLITVTLKTFVIAKELNQQKC